MDWIGAIHWVALFLVFLGPFLAIGAAFDWLVNFMLLLGIVVALATYNSGVSGNAVTYLLLAALAILVFPNTVGYGPLIEYVREVVTLGAWYILPIAIAQGWKSLIG